ncbi:hypothetical protein OHA72_54190 [Dactylosporangium sp. NBC_01737]|uniref:hypothetical protein n=1 Tax=Dactylosporangium sp. NBC_01737 TaxID=2975959 RepID=UPI002E11FDC3|nr:hypothetical protein OHA72_54190 [Dactylosporangium sp. NBC_01737]
MRIFAWTSGSATPAGPTWPVTATCGAEPPGTGMVSDPRTTTCGPDLRRTEDLGTAWWLLNRRRPPAWPPDFDGARRTDTSRSA